MAAHVFVEPISGREMTVVIDPSKHSFDAATVPHEGCATPADVCCDLDCFHCSACHLGGRISGAWVIGPDRRPVVSRAVGVVILAFVGLIVVVGVALWWRGDQGPENGAHRE